MAVGPAEEQLVDGLVAEAIPCAIPGLADLRRQHMMVIGGCQAQDTLDLAPFFPVRELLCQIRAALVRCADAHLGSQFEGGLLEADLVALLDVGEDVTTAATTIGEVVPGLRPGPDDKRGPRLMMKRAEPFQRAARFAQLDVGADDRGNVSPTTYFVDKRSEMVHSSSSKQAQRRPLPTEGGQAAGRVCASPGLRMMPGVIT
jgi:hypothetical protein